MSTTEVTKVNDNVNEKSDDKPSDIIQVTKTEINSYVLIGVLAFVLVCLLYYAYVQFTENSNAQDQEKNDDPVDDFNLREAIQELQEMQKKILGTLSENVY